MNKFLQKYQGSDKKISDERFCQVALIYTIRNIKEGNEHHSESNDNGITDLIRDALHDPDFPGYLKPTVSLIVYLRRNQALVRKYINDNSSTLSVFEDVTKLAKENKYTYSIVNNDDSSPDFNIATFTNEIFDCKKFSLKPINTLAKGELKAALEQAIIAGSKNKNMER